MAVTTGVGHHTTSASSEFEGLSDDIEAEVDNAVLKDTMDRSVLCQELGTWKECG